MGEGALAPLINDSVDPYARYEHVGEGVFIAPSLRDGPIYLIGKNAIVLFSSEMSEDVSKSTSHPRTMSDI